MINPILIRRRQRRYKPRVPAVDPYPPLAGPPVLVGATYDPVGLTLVLTFDRALDISGLVANQIHVIDPVINNGFYLGTGAGLLLNAGTIQLDLYFLAPASGTQTTLEALDASGVDSLADGAEWAGVSDVALPFNE